MLATYRIAAVLVALHAVVAAAAADDAYTIVTHWNAVPSGTSFDIDLLTGCADKCTATPGCYQWTWNYGHVPRYYCFVSTSLVWGGVVNGHITSGCMPSKVKGCGVIPHPPHPLHRNIRLNGRSGVHQKAQNPSAVLEW